MRIDKYDGKAGGFRAPLAADWAGSATAIGVGLDTNGRVVAGVGNTGIVGVLCKPSKAYAGDQVDIMTGGEIVEFGGTAGTTYTAVTTTGVIGVTAADATHIKIGRTVEANRLIVRVY